MAAWLSVIYSLFSLATATVLLLPYCFGCFFNNLRLRVAVGLLLDDGKRQFTVSPCIAFGKLGVMSVQPAADRIQIIGAQVDVKQIVDPVNGYLAVGNNAVRLRLGQLAFFILVEFVADFADDLLENILDRDHPRGAAVFIDQDGHMRAFLLHFPKQFLDRYRFGYRHGRMNQLGQVDVGIVIKLQKELLGVHHADDLVLVTAYNRKTGVLLALDDLQVRGSGLSTYRQIISVRGTIISLASISSKAKFGLHNRIQLG